MSDDNNSMVVAGSRQLPMSHTTQVQAMVEAEEIKCFFLASQQFKRDDKQCAAAIIEMCQDPDVAENGLYSYRRGGALVEGPSIDLIEDISTIWGRIKSGWRVMDRAADSSLVHAYAIDFQTLKVEERQVWVKHYNYKALTDERDIYEFLANNGQRRKRACIEALIPKWILAKAVKEVINTLQGSDPRPLSERITVMVKAFREYGVNEAMLKKRLGSNVEALSLTQLVKLKAIYKSIKDGAHVSNFFDTSLAPPPQKPPATPPADVKPPKEDKPKGGKKTKDKAAEPPAETTDAPPEQNTETVDVEEVNQEVPPAAQMDWEGEFK